MQTITYFNPLNPTETKSEICNFNHSSQIRKQFQYDAIAYELVIARNNQIIIEDCEIIDTDIVSVVLRPRGGGDGGGKNILATVAMIALVAAAPIIASTIIGWSGVAVSALEFSIIQAGIVAAGGMLVNAVLPPNIPDAPSLSNSLESQSQTYSWSQAINTTNQGDAMPRLFGTFRVTPRLIAKHIDSIGDKQYFNGLYLVNDGLTYYVGDVKINDEDISNFPETSYEVNYGLTNQQIIPQFDDISNDKNIAKKLSYATYSETSTDGDAVSTITATLVFPRGLYRANDDGSLGNNSVKVVVEYSADEINWTQFGDDTIVQSWKYWGLGYDNIWQEYTAINGSPTGYTQSYAPAGAQYVKSEGGKFMIFKWYQSPYTYALNYTTITNNTSSTFRKTFSIGYLPANKYYVRAKFYENPATGSRYSSDCYFEYLTEKTSYDFTYPGQTLLSIRALATDQLSGGMPTITCIASSGSSNPSLVVQAILEECGITSDRFSSKFDEWETYCDDNNLFCNIYFDATTDVRQAINYVSTIGRASVLQFGSKFDVIIDKAEIIQTQGFTLGMGNILKDTFKQSFLPLKDRANLVEVSYYDIENDYQKTALQLGEENYDSVDESSKISVNLIGCVDRSKAIEHAKLLLNYNRYLTQTFTFQADIDSLVCKVGDIVRISHDLPQYGFSGRIISSTITNAVLDRDVTIENGKSYYLQVRRSSTNEILEIPLQTIVGTSSTVTFTSAISLALNHLDNYSFGEINKTDVKARVLNIRTTSEFLRELTCIEYNESVYDLTAEPIIHNFSSFNLSNLRINDYIRYAQDKSIETVVNVAWSGSSIYYTVTANNKTHKVYDQIIDLTDLVDGSTYLIEVKDSYGNKISSNYTVIGKLAPPLDIDSLSASEVGNVFSLTWTHENIEIDFQEYVIYLNNSEVGRTKIKSFEYFSRGLDTKSFTVKVCDTSNVLSDGVSINTQASAPEAISNLTIIEELDDWALSWSYGYMPTDFKTFQIYQDNDLVGETSGFVFKAKINKIQSNFRVIAIDTAGNQSTYTQQTATITPLNDVASVNSSYLNNNILMFWDKISTTRTPIFYEVKKGNSWENAQFIEKTTDYKLNIFSNGTYMIKATYQYSSGLKIESENPKILIVDEAQLLKNVLVTWNEFETNWSGTLTNTQVNDDGYLTLVSTDDVDEYLDVDSIINFDYGSEIVSQGMYEIPLAHNVSLAWPKVCTLSYNLELEVTSVRNDFDALLDVDSVNAIDGYIGSDFVVEVQISTSQDGVNFGDYSKFIAGDYLAQAFKFRLVLSSFNQDVTPIITNFEFTVDMPDLYESGNDVSNTSIKTITYQNNFSTAPDVQITIVNATVGDDAILTNQTDESFDIIIKNSSTNVVRTFNYFVKGY